MTIIEIMDTNVRVKIIKDDFSKYYTLMLDREGSPIEGGPIITAESVKEGKEKMREALDLMFSLMNLLSFHTEKMFVKSLKRNN